MKSVQQAKLISILYEAQERLRDPNNDFSWSSWRNAEAALTEVNQFIVQLKQNKLTSLLRLQTLFAPTGPIQEVSLTSGWGEDFLLLAQRFDEIKLGDLDDD